MAGLEPLQVTPPQEHGTFLLLRQPRHPVRAVAYVASIE
jgi:hypothetical protein